MVYDVLGLSAALCYVVTSNGVTVCGNKLPPTVSKHCQQQHSAIHKNIQQHAVPKIPAVVISKIPYPQANIMAAIDRSKSRLLRDVCPELPT